MKVLISGGCKNGKSSHAERIAKKQGAQTPLYYLATMEPHDSEDQERIRRHRESRADLGFTTVEIGRDIVKALTRCDKNGSFLLDSTTALLANEMFLEDGTVNSEAHLKIARELSTLMKNLPNLVIVSDYIYSDSLEYDPFTEAYRRALAYIDRACAKEADVVLEACVGQLIPHKGGELLESD